MVYDKDVLEKRKYDLIAWGGALGNLVPGIGQVSTLISTGYLWNRSKELNNVTPKDVYSKPDMTSDMQPIYFNGKEIPQSNFPIVEWGAITNGTVRPNIYVTLPEGAVNMTVNKEENIDYEELVSLVGWHVANAVRYAEQNLK
ncbi:hypothetical protein D3C78_973500 [compost metagenome]